MYQSTYFFVFVIFKEPHSLFDLSYRVYQGFKLNLGKRSSILWLFLSHFWPLLTWAKLIWAVGQLPKISLILKPNQLNQVKLVQIPDTHCIISNRKNIFYVISIQQVRVETWDRRFQSNVLISEKVHVVDLVTTEKGGLMLSNISQAKLS